MFGLYLVRSGEIISGQRISLRASMIASQPTMMSKPIFLKKTLETKVVEAVSF